MTPASSVCERCPRCGDDSDVWYFEQTETTVTKEHYSCGMCGCEWTEIRQD
jgi:DNA-directed RNA polymerase subunit M/transcription elongation factor TFIIS